MRPFRSTHLLRAALAGLALAAVSLSGQAQTRPFITGMITAGGDTMSTAEFTDGTSRAIKAGGLFQFGGGLEYRPEAAGYSLQASLGYHVDTVVARNGDMTFSRLPLELLAFAHGSEQWRFGAGLRKALRAKYSESVDGTPDYSTRMTAKPGFIVQAEYLWDERGSVFVRYVAEKYEHHYAGWGGEYTDTYKGDHVGVGLSFRF